MKFTTQDPLIRFAFTAGAACLLVTAGCQNDHVIGETGGAKSPPVVSFNGAPCYSTGGGYASSVAIGDVNGDGKADLVLTDRLSSDASVLINDGQGGFADPRNYPVGGKAVAASLGDLNGDGSADIAVLDDGGLTVLLNAGGGEFASESYRLEPRTLDYPPRQSIMEGDLDGDGYRDLVILSRSGTAVLPGLTVLINHGDGTFATPVTYMAGTQPVSLAMGDFDGDGTLDLAVSLPWSQYDLNTLLAPAGVSVLLNNGDGTFAPPVAYAIDLGSDVLAAADMNGDGKTDLVTVQTKPDLPQIPSVFSVLTSVGGGALVLASETTNDEGAAILGIALGDVNGDGRPDAIAVDEIGVAHVFANDGQGGLGLLADYPAGNTSSGIGLGDINGDGRLDLVTPGISDHGYACVLMNEGHGSFAAGVTHQPARFSRTAAVGDLDGDGIRDIVDGAEALDGTGGINIFLGNADGSLRLTEHHVAAPRVVAVADLNGDTRPDIVLTDLTAGVVTVFLNQGKGTFDVSVSYDAGMITGPLVVDDLNADGKPDLAVAIYDAKISILLNRGDGTFNPATAVSTGGFVLRSLAVGDVNGDGRPDLAVADDDDNIEILLNQRQGWSLIRQALSLGFSSYVIALADLNDDGKADLLIADYVGAAVNAFLSDGNGGFSPAGSRPMCGQSMSVAVGDLNHDGRADLVFGGEGRISVLVNDGQGGIGQVATYAAAVGIHSIMINDVNNDGRPDIVVGTGESGVLEIINNSR